MCRSGTRCMRLVQSAFSVGVTGSSDKPQLPAGADWGWGLQSPEHTCRHGGEHAGAFLRPCLLMPLPRSFWNMLFTFGSAFGGWRGHQQIRRPPDEWQEAGSPGQAASHLCAADPTTSTAVVTTARTVGGVRDTACVCACVCSVSACMSVSVSGWAGVCTYERMCASESMETSVRVCLPVRSHTRDLVPWLARGEG